MLRPDGLPNQAYNIAYPDSTQLLASTSARTSSGAISATATITAIEGKMALRTFDTHFSPEPGLLHQQFNIVDDAPPMSSARPAASTSHEVVECAVRSRSQGVCQPTNRDLGDEGKGLSLENCPGVSTRPAFEDLPFRSKDDPKASAWGLWGPNDELGTLNYLTPEVTRQAATEVKTGEVVPLKLVLTAISFHLFSLTSLLLVCHLTAHYVQ